MSDILNPYIAGAPVVETSMFFGREDIFSWIERSLAGKYVDHILVLHGQRRVGKTSVLKQIPNFLPNKYIQVFFDLQGRTGTTLNRFLWWLASEIVRTLKKERGITLPKPDRKAFKDTEYLITEFLPSLQPILGEHVLLLTFDEFDTLDRAEIQEEFAKPLIAYLRRLIEMDGLSFIFSIGSSGDKLENMQASYTDFFKSALYRKISFLTRDDCYRLITKPVEGVIKYDKKAVDQIAKISSGHPYFAQLTCHELFSRCQKTGSREVSAKDVEAILEDVIERGTVNLKFIWDEASNLEKWILAALAQMDGGNNKKLAKVLNAQRVRFSDSDLNSAVIHLQDKDVITQDNHFVIHLMRMWLIANRPMDRVREELVEVNPISNRYIEIGDEYRDRNQNQVAIESYQQALGADPGNLKAQSSIATIYLKQEDYPEAVTAFELALKIDDEDVVARTGYCNAHLALGDAARAKNDVKEAIICFQSILAVNPDHENALQRLSEIRQIANDYTEAQQSIRKKRYGHAIELLQGIIAQDPTYKSTSRLLVEAVEANKAIPIWRRPWVLPAVGIVAFIVLGIFFGPRAWNAISTTIANRPLVATEVPISGEATNVSEIDVAEPTITAVETPMLTTEPSPVSTVESPAFYEPILVYIESEPTTFEDDFSTAKREWGINSIGNSVINMRQDDTLLLTNHGADFSFPINGLLNATDFAISFDLIPDRETEPGSLGLIFRSSANLKAYLETYYRFKFSLPSLTAYAAPYDAWRFSQADGSSIRTTKNGSTNLKENYNSILIIVQQKNLTVFLNDKLLYEDSNIDFQGDYIFITKSGVYGSSANLDNVKFWNLDGVDINQ